MTRSDDKPRVYGAVVYPLVFAENCETRDDSVPGIRAMNFARVRPEIASGRSERKTRDRKTFKRNRSTSAYSSVRLIARSFEKPSYVAVQHTLANDSQPKDAFPLWSSYSVRQHFWNSNHTQPREIIVSHSRHSFTAKLAYLTSTFTKSETPRNTTVVFCRILDKY